MSGASHAIFPATPLVGRDRELASLRAQLDAVLAGRGSLVLIGGEAGIGKTALAEALLAEARERGALVLVGRCYDLAETPPYGPWQEALLRVPRGDGLAPPPDLGSGGGLTNQAAFFAAVRDDLIAVAARRPLALLLDDLHWADPASLELLRIVGRQLADAPILLLVTYRADEVPRRHRLYQLLPLLVREARALRLDLRPLDEAAQQALIAARYALPPADEARLVAALRARAEGNPFFTGELLRAFEEAAVLREDGGGWVLGDLGAIGVPPLLRQVIDGRVDRLGEAARALLAGAAVIGQVVPLDLWGAISGAEEDALLDLLDRAAAALVLTETPDGTSVQFAHALVREALYAGLPPARRRALHRRIGEALLAAPAPDPDAVAHHFRQAGDARAFAWLIRAGERAQRAYALLTAAEHFEAALALPAGRGADPGERGWLLFRLARMGRHATPGEGLGALAEASRLGAAAGDRGLVALCRIQQGYLRCFTGNLRTGLGELAAGVEAHAALGPGDRDRLRARAEIASMAYDQHDYRGLYAVWLAWAGRYAEAEALAGRYDRSPAQPEPTRAGDSAHADAQSVLGMAHTFLGRPLAARSAFADALVAFRTVGSNYNAWLVLMAELEWRVLRYESDQRAARQRRQAAAEAAWEQARGAYGAASPDEPRLPLLLIEGHWTRARAALEAARGAGFVGWRAHLALWLGPLARAQGDPALARALVREWLPDGPGTEPGGTIHLCALVLQRLAAALALDGGDRPAACAWLEAHDRWLAWGGVVLGRAEGEIAWAEYHRAAGDPARALAHAESAHAHASTPRQPLALLAARRLLGELATAAGYHDAAAAHLDAAFALADACAAPYERALTLLARADLRVAERDHGGARAALEEARALLVPLGARPALARVDTLAARLAAHPAPVPGASAHPLPAGLSAREAEVLRLVARGLDNAEIAARLFLSPRTVSTHLTNIYAKLNVDGRPAAIRIALDHGLR